MREAFMVAIPAFGSTGVVARQTLPFSIILQEPTARLPGVVPSPSSVLSQELCVRSLFTLFTLLAYLNYTLQTPNRSN